MHAGRPGAGASGRGLRPAGSTAIQAALSLFPSVTTAPSSAVLSEQLDLVTQPFPLEARWPHPAAGAIPTHCLPALRPALETLPRCEDRPRRQKSLSLWKPRGRVEHGDPLPHVNLGVQAHAASLGGCRGRRSSQPWAVGVGVPARRRVVSLQCQQCTHSRGPPKQTAPRRAPLSGTGLSFGYCVCTWTGVCTCQRG